MFKLSKFSTGFMVGFGAGFISRDLLSNGSSVLKPVIKGFMKAGVTLVEKGRESIAGFTETLEDLMAEVRSEHFSKASSAAAPATAEATPAPAVKPTQEAAKTSKAPSSVQKS